MTAPDPAAAIVDRVGRPFVVEAVRMLEAGEASVDAVDAATTAAGYRLGPFALLDRVGLDVDLAIDRALTAAMPGEARFEAPSLQVRLVAEGRLGASTGRGFYRYDPPAPPGVDVHVPVTAALDAAAIVERLGLGVINEAYRAVEEGLASPSAIDAAMRAAGHPRGPFEQAGELGLRRVIERLRALHAATAARSAEQYRVAPLLWQTATI